MFTSNIFGGWGADEQTADSGQQSQQPAAQEDGAGLSFWSVAAAVTSTVRKQATELVTSVTETDWKSEIAAFGKEVSHDTHVLSTNAVHMVDHLPALIETLPEQAEKALPAIPPGSEVSHTLEAVGTSITQFGRSLLVGGKELIEQVKDAVETEIAAAAKDSKRSSRSQRQQQAGSSSSSAPPRYSRFDAEVSAMQRDSSTYCDEPEDKEDYSRWRSSFHLASSQPEISRITGENPFMAELQSRIVPLIVEHDDFWHRYFYRLHKLQQKEEQRQQVAQMAKSMPSDDELAWDDLDEAVDKVLAEVQDASSDVTSDLRSLTASPEPEFDLEAADEVAPVRPPKSTPSAAAALEVATSPAAPAVTEQSGTAGSTVASESRQIQEETSSRTPEKAGEATAEPVKKSEGKKSEGADGAPAAASTAAAVAASAVAVVAATEAVGTPLESVSSSASAEGAEAEVDVNASHARELQEAGPQDVAQTKAPEGHDDAGSNSSGKTEWSLVSANATSTSATPSELSAAALVASGEEAAAGSAGKDVENAAAVAEGKKGVAKEGGDDDDDFDDADLEDLPPADGDEEVDEDWGNWD